MKIIMDTNDRIVIGMILAVMCWWMMNISNKLNTVIKLLEAMQ
jgi:hypothetical protein